MRRPGIPVPGAALLALWLLLPAAAGAQIDPKADFIGALARFGAALDGAYGDEGETIRASLDAMARGLAAWDAAIARYAQALDAGAPTAAVAAQRHLAMGVVYFERRRVDDARRAFAAARRLDPSRAEVHTLEGLLHHQLTGDMAAAEAAFRRAAALDPPDLARAYTLAHHLLTRGRVDEAQAVLAPFANDWLPPPDAARLPFLRPGPLQETTGVAPFFPPVGYEEGFRFVRRGQHAEAIEAFRRAAAGDPLLAAGATIRAAAAAFRAGDLAAARAHLERAGREAPEAAEPQRLLGLVLAADGRHAAALDALRRAVRLDPANERARLALAGALAASGDTVQAQQALRDTVQALPASGRALYELARLHQQERQYREALEAFERAAAFEPLLGLNGIYQAIGALRAALQDDDGAIAAYRQRVALHPNAADAHYDLATVHLRRADAMDALMELALAVRLDPEHAGAWASFGQLHLRAGRLDAAVDAARRALALDPADKEPRYVLGTALLRLGRTEEGREELRRYQTQQEADAAAYTRALTLQGLRREAAVAARAGRTADTVALLEQALDLDPDSPDAHVDVGAALLAAGRAADARGHFEQAAALGAHYDVHLFLAEAHAALGDEDAKGRALAEYERLRQASRSRP